MHTIHVSFCHTSKPCDDVLNPMLEALKVQVLNGLQRNVYYVGGGVKVGGSGGGMVLF